MATVADSIRRAVDIARTVPAQLGLHPHTVKMVVTRFAGSNTGRGAATTQELQLLVKGTNPRVVWLNNAQLIANNWDNGTIEVGPLTPTYDADTGEGWSFDELSATGIAAVQNTIHLVVQGPRVPNGQKYLVKEVLRKNFRWILRASPVT